MNWVFPILRIAVVVVVICVAGVGWAQQVTVSTPYHSLSESFYERWGTSWNLDFPGGFINFGGANPGVPPFGNFNPSAGAQVGYGIRGGDLSGNINFFAGQGVQRSFVSQTPMVTLQNGYPGFFHDTSISPFVVGYVPVVGSYPTFPFAMPVRSPTSSGSGADAVRDALQQVQATRNARQGDLPDAPAAALAPAALAPAALAPAALAPAALAPAALAPAAPVAAPAGMPAARPRPRPADINLAAPALSRASADPASGLTLAQGSSAGRPAPSVAEARRMHEAEQGVQDGGTTALWNRAQQAEQTGNLGAARVYYQMLSRRADGQLKQQALDRLTALKTRQ